MKVFGLTLLFGLAVAVPTTPVQPGLKKANISDVATIGYATLNGGTTGGFGGQVVTVSTLAEFVAAVAEKNTAPAIVLINGTLVGNDKVRIGSNKTIIGLPGSSLRGIGLIVRKQRNLIVRNLNSSFVLASNEDALKIDESTNIWVDHCEFYSDLLHDKDYYDGLVDSSHGSDLITISHTYFHDHAKTSLVGHSDSNAAQDKGKLRITYANNYWKNVGSRTPLIRFGTAHIFNSLYQSVGSGINTRMGAQALVQNNVFKNVTTAITSRDSKEVGFAVVEGNDLGRGTSNAPSGSLHANDIPYKFTLLNTSAVASLVPLVAGPILTFDIPTTPTTTTTSSVPITTTSTKTSTSSSSPTTLTRSTKSRSSTTSTVSSSTATISSSPSSTSSTRSSTASTSNVSTSSAPLSPTSKVTTPSSATPQPTSSEPFTTTPQLPTITRSLTDTYPSTTAAPTTSEAEECDAEPTSSEPFTTTPQLPTITSSLTEKYPSTTAAPTTSEAEECEAEPTASVSLTVSLGI
ncbi:pectin lyase fold/virulence factor [Cladorrhinum sp. PSN259]|nr:pectin lyase fold/virulence factor [Cladorrhinum sp. PSN259]